MRLDVYDLLKILNKPRYLAVCLENVYKNLHQYWKSSRSYRFQTITFRPVRTEWILLKHSFLWNEFPDWFCQLSFRFAAVHGSTCSCGNVLVEEYVEVDNSNCGLLCPGYDVTDTSRQVFCGGPSGETAVYVTLGK